MSLSLPRVADLGLQKFLEEVRRILTAPRDSSIPWMVTREFTWCTDRGDVDIALGTPLKPKGLIVLMCEREGQDIIFSNAQLTWAFRSGYARVTAVEGTGGVNSSLNHRVILGVIL